MMNRSETSVLLTARKSLRAVVVFVIVLGTSDGSQRLQGADREFTAEQIEHFEKRIRPILAARCYACHSATAKRLEASLYLDTRSGMLAGGDTGPAIVPGRADESLLIQAIRYDGDYLMPPKGKIPDSEIQLLERWVQDGAPWPQDPAGEAVKRAQFDLQERLRSQWVWQPVQRPAVPTTRMDAAGLEPIDRFVIRRLEDQGLAPNGLADRETLIRRLYFDLIGLPPEPAEIDSFVNDSRPDAVEQLVDRLLESKHFGERWGRHWLDLVRYAESRGHEFDYDTPNAYEYRDWVIRAFNADLPYDQFVVEQIAGDLLPEPRRHPEEGFNESIIGTGFWFLGEWVHSPVDIRKDEADRHDNMIDVFGKTFLGVTIACARCHDHKFDPISQRDYYAMSGFLQSSAYRLARFESLDHNRQVALELGELRREANPLVAADLKKALQTEVEKLPRYLLASREVLTGNAVVDADQAQPRPEVVVADFESGTLVGWTATGNAFGEVPATQSQIADYQGNVNAVGKFFVNSHNPIGKSGRVEHGDGPQGRLRSDPFLVSRRYLTLRVGGGAHEGKTCINLLVDGNVVGSLTGRNNNRMRSAGWDLVAWQGRQVQLEIVDEFSGGWGNIGADHFVLKDSVENDVDLVRIAAVRIDDKDLESAAKRHDVNPERLRRFIAALGQDADTPFDGWKKVAEAGSDEEAVQAWQNWISRPAITDLRQCLTDQKVVVDFGRLGTDDWRQDGVMFGLGPVPTGELLLGADPEHPVAGVVRFSGARRDVAIPDLQLAAGAANDGGRLGSYVRAGQTIRTPTFDLEDGNVHVLVAGSGYGLAVVDSHRMLNGPLHGQTLTNWQGEADEFRWISFNLTRYRGHNVHLEFTPRDNRPLQVMLVVEGQRPNLVPDQSAVVSLWTESHPGSVEDIAELYHRAFREAIRRLGMTEEANLPAVAIAELQNWLVKNREVFQEAEVRSPWSPRTAELLDEIRQTAGKIKGKSRVAMAMWDGDRVDEHLMIRGNPGKPGDEVGRRILEALGGSAEAFAGPGSGRLELAQQVVNPSNPLTSRVIVNRLWHHLFGRGIVASVDNFGVLGEKPSHPELLDYLASEFVQDGWSIKRMIRRLVLTRAYQMSSQTDAATESVDPGNVLLHRARIRRLEGEAIRDAMLAVSGRLDPTSYGPSVPVFVSDFMEGRGRPRSGPLDGNGRRSIYISVRRNFLPAMMLAFDMPQPFSSMGRRTVSNVPAQALILLNDPFVQEQARLWAGRLLEESVTDAARVERMYLMAFGRRPTTDETQAALKFLDQSALRYGLDPAVRQHSECWSELCHVMFNVKEFIFLR